MIAIRVDWKNPERSMRSIDMKDMSEENALYEFCLVHHLLVDALSDVLKVSHDVAQIKLMELAATTDAAFKDADSKAEQTIAECELDEESLGQFLGALGDSDEGPNDELQAELEAMFRKIFSDDEE